MYDEINIMNNELNTLKLQNQIYELREDVSYLSVALVSVCKMLDEDKLNSLIKKIEEETDYKDNINKIKVKKKELDEQIKVKEKEINEQIKEIAEWSSIFNLDNYFKDMFKRENDK